MRRIHTTESLFPRLNEQAYGVINTSPAGQPWYVVVNQKDLEPCWEGDQAEEAVAVADRLAQANDLAFLSRVLSDERSITTHHAGESLLKSDDGLSLLPPGLVQSQGFMEFTSEYRSLLAGNPDWEEWTKYVYGQQQLISVGNKTIIVDAEIAKGDGDQTENVTLMLNMDWASDFPESLDLRVIDDSVMVGKQTLRQLLLDRTYFRDGGQRVCIEDVSDFKSDAGPSLGWFEENMPAFVSHVARMEAAGTPLDLNKLFVFEGGKVLNDLVATRPWMVETDATGQPIPLVILRASGRESVTEDDLDRKRHWLSSIVVRDHLTKLARSHVIDHQKSQGVVMGQKLSELHAPFVKVAEVGGLVLEAAWAGEKPNGGSGMRDVLAHRVWYEGELVIDASPASPHVFDARVISLSPIGGRIDPDALQLSDKRVGELLSMALTEIDDERDARLPDRVNDFLGSLTAEYLQADASRLEEGTAHLVNGVFVAHDEEDDQPANALTV